MPQLPVKGLPRGDNGRLLVRLSYKFRDGIKRFGIGKITNNANQQSLIVLVLGHADDDAIFMPYDIRTALDVSNGGDLDFSIKKVGFIGRLCWYVGSPDPAVSIPAWIAVVGLTFTLVGLILATIPLMFI